MQAPSEFDLRELDKFKKLSAHYEIAIARAIDYCATNEICPPAWLVKALAPLTINLLKREKAGGRGRTATHIARFRHEYWDIERWDAVHEVRHIRWKVGQDDAALKAFPNRVMTEKWKEFHEKRKKWLKQGTFQCAARLLVGRDAYASSFAVQASYRKVERYLNEPEHAVGAWFEDDFLKKLGLQGVLDRKPGIKYPYFFDLT